MTPTTPKGVSIIIPVYNEEGAIEATIQSIREVCTKARFTYELLVVDDGSTDGTRQTLSAAGIVPLQHDLNLGYGASIKTGIRHAQYDVIAIIDADGTYPAEKLPDMVAAMIGKTYDMVIGARTGPQAHVPWMRRPGKWILRRLAMAITGMDIPDLNSGLRVFRRELFERYETMFPEGFSFTTTITMIALTNGYRVKFLPINYHKRIGQSSIHPVRDFLGFLMLIVRLAVYFKPLKIFLPVSVVLFVIGSAKAVIDVVRLNHFGVGGVTVVLAALQLAFLGLLADLILHRTRL